MTKPIRYAWVSNNRTIKHRFYGRKFVEGELTQCGIRVQKGWAFWYGNRKRPTWGDVFAKTCKRCDQSSDRDEQR